MRAQESEAAWPAAPETTEELLALAAVAPRPAALRWAAPNPRPLARQQPVSAIPAAAEQPAPVLPLVVDSAPTPAEYYARSPHTLRAQHRPAASAPVMLAQASSEPVRASAAALLSRSAAAPQLAAVGATTTRTAREATSGNEDGRSARGTAGVNRRSGPTPATRREIEEARAARSQIVANATIASASAPRRRVAMHRVAAAAASSLNEATPFRTSGSGGARFSGAEAGATLGEGLDRAAEAVSVVPGLRLEGVSLSAGYSSNSIPGARSIFAADSALGSDTDFRGEATLAFRKRFRSSSFGLTYTPSRQQRSRFSEWNTTDHVLALTMDRQLGRRWGVGFNASAADTGLEQFWFRRPSLRQVENPPASFDELLQRVQAGEFTDEEFASILTGSPIVDDPGGRETDLSRVTSLSSSLSASYAASARTSLTLGGGISTFGSSFRTGPRDRSDRPQITDLSRQFAFAQSSHKINPRLTAGVRYNLGVNSSSFGDSINHSAVGYANRKLSRFWDAGVEAGMGYVSLDAGSGILQRFQGSDSGRPTWVAGGSVGYRYGGHAFRANARRQVGDTLGLSTSATLSGGVDWQWASPRMPWVFTGGASYSRSNFGFAAFDGSSTALESALLQAGVTRRLSATTALSTGYYFGRFNSPLRGLLTGATVHRVQASFLWRPVEQR